MSEETSTTQTYVCVNHPNRPTTLRCNRCGDPICPECAVLTPTGYRCKKCVRTQQKVYVTAKSIDYPVAFVVAALLSLGGSYLVSFIITSFLGFFTIFIGPIAGGIIAEAVRRVTARRRGKTLFMTATAGAIAGVVPLFLIYLASGLLGLTGRGGFMGLLPFVFYGLYAFLSASAVYARLSGIQMRR